MQLTIELTPQQGVALSTAASSKGVDDSELARDLAMHLSEFEVQAPTVEALQVPAAPDAENLAAMAMLQSWLVEDATEDPEEIRKAEQELEEFRLTMNANRLAAGETPVYPWHIVSRFITADLWLNISP